MLRTRTQLAKASEVKPNASAKNVTQDLQDIMLKKLTGTFESKDVADMKSQKSLASNLGRDATIMTLVLAEKTLLQDNAKLAITFYQSVLSSSKDRIQDPFHQLRLRMVKNHLQNCQKRGGFRNKIVDEKLAELINRLAHLNLNSKPTRFDSKTPLLFDDKAARLTTVEDNVLSLSKKLLTNPRLLTSEECSVLTESKNNYSLSLFNSLGSKNPALEKYNKLSALLLAVNSDFTLQHQETPTVSDLNSPLLSTYFLLLEIKHFATLKQSQEFNCSHVFKVLTAMKTFLSSQKYFEKNELPFRNIKEGVQSFCGKYLAIVNHQLLTNPKVKNDFLFIVVNDLLNTVSIALEKKNPLTKAGTAVSYSIYSNASAPVNKESKAEALVKNKSPSLS